MKTFGMTGVAALLALAACSEEVVTPDETEPVEQGGKAAGDVQGGSISDAMIPLEQLRSQSPTLERQTTTTVTTSDGEGGTSTTIETTTVTTEGEGGGPAPVSPAAPPEPPATPGE